MTDKSADEILRLVNATRRHLDSIEKLVANGHSTPDIQAAEPAPKPKPEPEIPDNKGGAGCFDLIGFINNTMGGTGIPVTNQRADIEALIKKWGYDRIKSVATEQAPAMDNKTWGYRIAVLRNHAEPKAPPINCPNCGRFPTGTKILRIPQNYRSYAKVTNPTYDTPEWVGRPHWYCQNCAYRAAARPGEFEKAKEEAAARKEKRGRRGRGATNGPVGVGAILAETVGRESVLADRTHT